MKKSLTLLNSHFFSLSREREIKHKIKNAAVTNQKGFFQTQRVLSLHFSLTVKCVGGAHVLVSSFREYCRAAGRWSSGGPD